MQVLPPSVSPGPAELSQYKLTKMLSSKLGICSLTPLTGDINLCFSNPDLGDLPGSLWEKTSQDFILP